LEEADEDTSSMSYDGTTDLIIYRSKIHEGDRVMFDPILNGVEEIYLLFDARTRES